MLHAKVTVMR